VRFGGDYQRTVVFIRYEAETGQDVFIRGGTPMADGVEDFSGEMMRLAACLHWEMLYCVFPLYTSSGGSCNISFSQCTKYMGN
jgi:hypothetical protein